MSKNITSKLTRREIFGMFNEKPCDDAVTWLENQPDIETAWETCERGDWMIWALRHIDNPPDMEFWLKLAIWAPPIMKNEHAPQADWVRENIALPRRK
ncbi:MAG TPA: hypothetical protein PKC99_12645 [Anaerolineales bacterium]|nr:hypothetical protein [Anaerolineales bacterium]